VTCDVAIYALFFSQTDYAVPALPTEADQAALWENLATIDVFSIGVLPYEIGQALGHPVSAKSGVEESLPLLLTAVDQGRLTLEDISLRLSENPRSIFGLPEQPQTYVEVEISRQSTFSSEGWSPIGDKSVSGAVHRVVINGHSVFLDGTTFSMPLGRDVSIAGPRKTARTSFSLGQKRPSIAALPMSPGATGGSFQQQQQQQPLMALSSSAPREVSPVRNLASLQNHPAFSRRHIVSVKQFTREDLHVLFNLASEMRTQVERTGSVDTLRGRVLCTLFYEPSTRTSTSFEAAMKRCGGEVVSVTASTSSVVKGESLADTIRTVGCYADAVALRHPEVGSSKSAAKYSPVPIINAGDGIGEHPTQSLLDVFCIREELGSVNGITVTLSECELGSRSYEY
jgi:carbamoyl-phosphate synthase/aspartate carbamoyltransferase